MARDDGGATGYGPLKSTPDERPVGSGLRPVQRYESKCHGTSSVLIDLRMVNLTALTRDMVAAILDDTMPNHVTLVDLAVDPLRSKPPPIPFSNGPAGSWQTRQPKCSKTRRIERGRPTPGLLTARTSHAFRPAKISARIDATVREQPRAPFRRDVILTLFLESAASTG